MFNLGKCTSPCKASRLHTCLVCGKQGHPASDCYQGKGKADEGKGTGKGKNAKDKRTRRGGRY